MQAVRAEAGGALEWTHGAHSCHPRPKGRGNEGEAPAFPEVEVALARLRHLPPLVCPTQDFGGEEVGPRAVFALTQHAPYAFGDQLRFGFLDVVLEEPLLPPTNSV